MGEAKSRSDMVSGWLTQREQVVLGLVLTGAKGRDRQDGNSEERRRKRRAFRELGLTWVVDRIKARSVDPAFAGKPHFEPADMKDDVTAAFEASRDSIGWVLDMLDRQPPAGPDDFTLAELEDRLADLKAGRPIEDPPAT